MSVISWLNEHSGAITVFTAVATVIVTVILVYITAQYARTTDRILRASDTPEILIFLFPDERSTYSINLCIQNIGTGFASDVKFTGDLSFKPFPPGSVALSNIGVFKNGIDYLPPGKKIEIFLFYTTHIQKLPVKSLNFTVSYVDSMGKQCKDSFFLEFNKWIGFTQRINDPLNKIVNELDGIRRKLH